MLDGFRTGDPLTDTALFERYNSQLCSLSWKYIQDWEEAKDIVAGVWEILFVKRPVFDNGAHLQKWLYVCTKNKSINFLIAQDHMKKRYTNWARMQDDMDFSEPFAWEKGSQQEKLLGQIMEELPTKTRAVLHGLYLQGKKRKVLAREMGISCNTVKSLRRYALTTIRSKYCV